MTLPRGTIVTADFLNAVNNHRHSGADADGAGALDYAVDSGSGNTYVITLSPALTAHVAGMPIVFKATHANTGAAILNVNGLGGKSLKNTVLTTWKQAILSPDKSLLSYMMAHIIRLLPCPRCHMGRLITVLPREQEQRTRYRYRHP